MHSRACPRTRRRRRQPRSRHFLSLGVQTEICFVSECARLCVGFCSNYFCLPLCVLGSLGQGADLQGLIHSPLRWKSPQEECDTEDGP